MQIEFLWLTLNLSYNILVKSVFKYTGLAMIFCEWTPLLVRYVRCTCGLILLGDSTKTNLK